MHPLRLYLKNVFYKFINSEILDKNVKILFIGYDNTQNGTNENEFNKPNIQYHVVEPFEKKPNDFWGSQFIESSVEEYSKLSTIKYDFIFCIGVLGSYNWSSKIITPFLESLKNLLSIKGKLIIHSPIHRFKGMKYNWNEDTMPIELFKDDIKKYFEIDNDLINRYFSYVENKNTKLINDKPFKNYNVNPEDYQDYIDVIYINDNYKKPKIDKTFKIFILKAKDN